MKLSWVIKHNRPEFKGTFYYLKDPLTWTTFIQLENKPINYLEIGVLKGIHSVRISGTYCKHPLSRIYCVDPWDDYNEYIEYKGEQAQNYNDFIFNITNSGSYHKFIVKKGYSEDIVPTFENNFFDIIFVDGNHETEYVYKDGVMSLEKVKIGGYIVFDDYDWKETKEGIDKFIESYKSHIKVLGRNDFQLFIQKL